MGDKVKKKASECVISTGGGHWNRNSAVILSSIADCDYFRTEQYVMKIALIGYGKMGKEIEKIAISRGHEITLRCNSSTRITPTDAKLAEIAIEFTKPDSAVENIQFCFDNNLPIIIGTTGWYQYLRALSAECAKKNGSMLYATNFSPGVNMFFAVNKLLAKVMNGDKGYNVSIEEIHHVQKKDAPSGTAITLAEQIIENLPKYNSWQNVKSSESSKPDIIPITSLRLPDVPGTHTVMYKSEIDDIEIKHTAHNRYGFALGSVLAAEWLKGKKGVFTFADVLKF
jgi:4-hydroxy-tetrahydrodipicolinate reductase